MKKLMGAVVLCLALIATLGSADTDKPATTGSSGTNSTTEAEADGGLSGGSPTSAEQGGTTTTGAPAEPADAQASPYVGGNISPVFAAGEPGALSVVAVGTPDGEQTSIPFVLRNNTNGPLYNLSATGRATDGGQLSGSGEDQGVEPAVVQPGEIAFGYVYFSGAPSPSATVEVTPTGEPQASDFFGDVPLVIGDANLVPGDFGEQIVGEVTTEGAAASGPISVMVLCVDQAGVLADVTFGFTDGDALGANSTATYSVDIFDPCPTFLIGSSGFTA